MHEDTTNYQVFSGMKGIRKLNEYNKLLEREKLKMASGRVYSKKSDYIFEKYKN